MTAYIFIEITERTYLGVAGKKDSLRLSRFLSGYLQKELLYLQWKPDH